MLAKYFSVPQGAAPPYSGLVELKEDLFVQLGKQATSNKMDCEYFEQWLRSDEMSAIAKRIFPDTTNAGLGGFFPFPLARIRGTKKMPKTIITRIKISCIPVTIFP